jgi:cyclophilin family peptidyl-prolyl cis-trans isomerase
MSHGLICIITYFQCSYTKDHELQTFAKKTIKDDPPFYPKIEFEEGMISFAGSGKDSRSSHLFVAYGKNPGLGTQLWETPIGTVIRGMETLKTLNHEYGDMPPWGKGPVQHDINTGGNEYIEKEFPHLDKFLMCHVIEHEIAETNDEEEKEVDDGGKDDLLQIDVHKLRETVHKQQLLRKSSEQINDTTSNHGFEVPLFVFFAVVVIILFGIKKRNKNKLSKSL